jgi:hypothetical protein
MGKSGNEARQQADDTDLGKIQAAQITSPQDFIVVWFRYGLLTI